MSTGVVLAVGLPASGLGRIGPGERRCFTVSGSPGDAALVNLTPVDAAGNGNGQLVSSDVIDPPTASNVNYTSGSVDPNVAIAPIGADGQVCYVNSQHTSTHLIADHLGTISAAAFQRATPGGAPHRALDTRTSGPVEPGERRCFTVSGSPGDAAFVNLTPVSAAGNGNGQLVSSDVIDPPTASNVNYTSGSVDPNVAIAPIGADGQVCYVNSQHTSTHLIADHLGTISAAAFQLATQTGAPARAGDTRGGSPLGPYARQCYVVAGAHGGGAIVNLTPVEAGGGGNGVLVSSSLLAPPAASNVNFRPGFVDPNIAVAPLGSDRAVCYVNSRHSAVHVIADHLGTVVGSSFQPASIGGAPARLIDTRGEVPPPAPTTTTVAPRPIGGGTCHSSYPSVCIPPPPPDLDCGDITARNFAVVGADPHRFDGDNDGIGCET